MTSGEACTGASYHANVKLTRRQLDYIEASGEEMSTWIREAVAGRISRETAPGGWYTKDGPHGRESSVDPEAQTRGT